MILIFLVTLAICPIPILALRKATLTLWLSHAVNCFWSLISWIVIRQSLRLPTCLLALPLLLTPGLISIEVILDLWPIIVLLIRLILLTIRSIQMGSLVCGELLLHVLGHSACWITYFLRLATLVAQTFLQRCAMLLVLILLRLTVLELLRRLLLPCCAVLISCLYRHTFHT